MCLRNPDSLMKSVLAAILVVFGCASAVQAAVPGTLTTLRAVNELSRNEAAQGPVVAFEATVTYYSAKDVDMFVQGNSSDGVTVQALARVIR